MDLWGLEALAELHALTCIPEMESDLTQRVAVPTERDAEGIRGNAIMTAGDPDSHNALTGICPSLR